MKFRKLLKFTCAGVALLSLAALASCTPNSNEVASRGVKMGGSINQVSTVASMSSTTEAAFEHISYYSSKSFNAVEGPYINSQGCINENDEYAVLLEELDLQLLSNPEYLGINENNFMALEMLVRSAKTNEIVSIGYVAYYGRTTEYLEIEHIGYKFYDEVKTYDQIDKDYSHTLTNYAYQKHVTNGESYDIYLENNEGGPMSLNAPSIRMKLIKTRDYFSVSESVYYDPSIANVCDFEQGLYGAVISDLYASNIDIINPELESVQIITDVTNPKTIEECLAEIHASDETDGDISDRVTLVSTTYDPANPVLGSHDFIVSVTDSADNTTQMTCKVVVYDVTNPTITATNKTTGNSTCLTQAELQALFTANDNYQVKTVEITSDGYTSNYKKPGTYNVVAKVTDAAGNTATATAKITVTDTTNPTISATNKSTGNSTCLTQTELKALFAYSDDVTATNSLTFEITSDGYTSKYRTPGTYDVTAKVTDAAGNSSTATAKITVSDTTKPTISAANKTQSYTTKLSQAELKALFTYSDDVTATNNLTLEITTDNYTAKYNTVGEYTVTARVTDAAGNSNTATAKITVQDKLAPVITAPATISVSTSDMMTEAALRQKITVTDGYDGEITDYTIEDQDGYYENHKTEGSYRFLITATDANGNSATFTITVTTSDEQAPYFWVYSDYTIVITQGETLSKDQIISFLSQVGEIDPAQVASVDYDEELAEETGTYDLSITMLDGSVYKTKLTVNAPANENVTMWYQHPAFWITASAILVLAAVGGGFYFYKKKKEE